jgi:hypothetical protein
MMLPPPGRDEADEALPGEVGLRAASPKRARGCAPDCRTTRCAGDYQRRRSRSDAFVASLQPSPSFRDGAVHTLAQLRLDRLERVLAGENAAAPTMARHPPHSRSSARYKRPETKFLGKRRKHHRHEKNRQVRIRQWIGVPPSVIEQLGEVRPPTQDCKIKLRGQTQCRTKPGSDSDTGHLPTSPRIQMRHVNRSRRRRSIRLDIKLDLATQ